MAEAAGSSRVNNALRGFADRVVAQPETLGDGDCESLHDGLLGQPVNTLSSFGYVAGGVWLATRIRSLAPRDRLPAAAFATFLALSGAGSVAYHGPQFAGAQLFHDVPIVGMVGMGVGVPLVRAVRSRSALPGATPARIAGTAALGVVSLGAYLLGRTGAPGCDPDSWIQPHGLWHLGTAAAATMWSTVLWPTSVADPALHPDRFAPAEPVGDVSDRG